jgi:hypothetical protein
MNWPNICYLARIMGSRLRHWRWLALAALAAGCALNPQPDLPDERGGNGAPMGSAGSGVLVAAAGSSGAGSIDLGGSGQTGVTTGGAGGATSAAGATSVAGATGVGAAGEAGAGAEAGATSALDPSG